MSSGLQRRKRKKRRNCGRGKNVFSVRRCQMARRKGLLPFVDPRYIHAFPSFNLQKVSLFEAGREMGPVSKHQLGSLEGRKKGMIFSPSHLARKMKTRADPNKESKSPRRERQSSRTLTYARRRHFQSVTEQRRALKLFFVFFRK